MKIMWQREFQLQEVKVLRFEVLGGNSPMNSISKGNRVVFKYKTKYLKEIRSEKCKQRVQAMRQKKSI
jgi:hypothetical protein